MTADTDRRAAARTAQQRAYRDDGPLARVLGGLAGGRIGPLAPTLAAGAFTAILLVMGSRAESLPLLLAPAVLLVLLAGALGVYDPGDDENPPGPAAVARHAPLLVADLLAVTGRPFAEYLTAAFAEVARTETHD